MIQPLIAVRLRRTVGVLLAQPAAARAVRMLDQYHWFVLLLFAGAWVGVTAAAARAKPFWHDELFTVLLSRLPSVGEFWAALGNGADLSAPLNTLLTRGVHALFGIGHVTTRIPPLAGTVLMIVAVFVFVRRRAGAIMGVAAIAILSYTAAYRYSYEARGYGLMSGFFALALVSWAEAAGGRRRTVHLPLMAVALAAAYWSHYFGVFALAPIAVGETVRAVRRKRPDVALWTAAIASLVAFVPLLALLYAGQMQASHFWSRAAYSDIRATYAFVFHELFNDRLLLATASALVIATLGRLTLPRVADRCRLPAHEAAAIVTCLLLPVIEVTAAMLTTGVFVPRYALPLAVGVALAIPLGISRLAARTTLAQMVFALILAVGFSTSVYHSIISPAAPFVNPVDQRPVLISALHEPRPVVVSGGLMFLQLWYYTPPTLRVRLWYLADPDEASKYTGADTIDRGLIALARYAPVNVSDYPSFMTRYPEFYVYTAGSGWLLDKVETENVVIEKVAAEPGGRLLLTRRGRITSAGAAHGSVGISAQGR